MSRFSLFFILGIVFLLLGLGFFNLIKSGWLNTPAAINNALQNLISQFFSPKNNFIEVPLVKKEKNPEASKKEEVPTSENYEENSIPIATDLALAEISEKLDDISEKIDVIIEETDKLFQEKGEEENKEQISKEEEEKEKPEEPKEEVVKIEENVVVYCQRGEGDPARNKLIFNEISWMGNSSDWHNEWLELKGVAENIISLTGWQILDKNQEIKIVFEEKDKISPNQLFLLERTNDDSVSNVLADKIYSGNLNDDNEILYLFDENCQLQDEVLANPNWPAGDKIERRSMERNQDLSWHAYSGSGENGILGTPKKENSQQLVFGGTSGGAAAPPEVTNLPKILISEVFFDAEGSDENQEFIELFNPNETETDISDWSIQYLSSNSASIDKIEKKNFEDGNKIETQNYFLIGLNGKEGDLKWSQSLGNTGGTIILVNNKEKITDINDANIVDRIGYGTGEGLILAEGTAKSLENFETGKSLARKWDEEKEEYQDTDDNNNDFEVQDSTPKVQNQSPAVQVPGVEDNVPPQVAFDQISSLQTSLSFSFYWVGQDFAPEGVTPSGINGFLLRYSEDKENWTYWPSETEYTQETQYLFKGEDGKTYYFQIKAKDKAENESDWSEALIEINSHPIVINEVYYDVGKDKGEEGENEWIEVYNRTNSTIDISGWIIEDNGGASRQRVITGPAEIPSKGFAVITPFESTWLYWVIPDTIVKITLNNKIGSYGLSNEGDRIILREPAGKEIDAMSYEDDITVFELPIAAKEGESLGRQTAGYDTDTASDWQVLNTPTPGQ